jgi:hypothetical protein
VVDSRPFQIFEGSNDVMYHQIAETILKEMKKQNDTNLYAFLRQFELTQKIAGYYKHMLNFKLNSESLQRANVALGKIVARLITTEFTFDLMAAGFRSDLVKNAIQVVGNTIAEQVSSVTQSRQIQVIEAYRDGSDWKTGC